MRCHNLTVVLFISILISSCHLRKQNQEEDKLHIDICAMRLSEYRTKFNFRHSLDTLKKVQPCVSGLAGEDYESIITRSLYDYIKKSYNDKLDEDQYDLFYKYPEHTVALYNFITGGEEVEEIENGIKIESYGHGK